MDTTDYGFDDDYEEMEDLFWESDEDEEEEYTGFDEEEWGPTDLYEELINFVPDLIYDSLPFDGENDYLDMPF